MSEYWIEVKGHPRYRVSTMGRVKCLNWNKTGKEKILKPCLKNGYSIVYVDRQPQYLHKLVLESFMPNPKNKPCIDHKDTNRLNNRLDNLRWVTYTENNRNPLTLKHMRENHPRLGKFGAENPTSKPIVQLTLDGQYIRKWGSAREVSRELGIQYQNISHCCRGRYNSAGGFKWKYASDYQRKSISEIKPLF